MDDGEASLGQASQVFSSSPGFGTPAYPINSRPTSVPIRPGFATSTATGISPSGAGSVLPILLPPQTLRPVAFRTLTKKHNLTVTSSALALLATFIGRFCGTGWRDESLAERLLDEVAKAWKAQDGGILIEDGPDNKLSAILKSLEPCMSAGRVDIAKLSRTNTFSRNPLSRQSSSLGLSGMVEEGEGGGDVDGSDHRHRHHPASDEPEVRYRDARPFITLISAFKQPRLVYSTTKKTMETVTGEPSFLAPVQHRTAMFRNRYNVIHQLLLRHESFQTPSFASAQPPMLQRSASSLTSIPHAYKLTPISNLLGRSGTSHLLLGLLALSPASDLCLADLSGSVVLDMTYARCVPEDGVWFCRGMIVLVNGMYEEDGSNNSTLGGAGGMGGQIKGRFVVDTLAGPVPEKREATLGIINHNLTRRSLQLDAGLGPAFGWIDFLGLGSEKAVGQQMRQIRRRILGPPRQQEDDQSGDRRPRTKVAILGECHLDSPRTLEAIRSILRIYSAASQPLAIVLMGNFVSTASTPGSIQGGSSVEYKQHMDALASVLSEFPRLLATTTFIFVPGDNDPWASSFSAGAATCLPRQPVPDLFTSRVRRAFAQANKDHGPREDAATTAITTTITPPPITAPGTALWASNPARVSLFGPVEELVLFRDDLAGPDSVTIDTQEARKLVKSLLDQSHLSPFPQSLRPVLSDYASALSLYPLPTALLLCDPTAPRFSVTYEACVVVNPGRVLDETDERRGGGASTNTSSTAGKNNNNAGAKTSTMFWAEYDVERRRAEIRQGKF
ncbi:hypothetical protein DV738_g5298, partial [Chaetothyriales sp. CBS 135597]